MPQMTGVQFLAEALEIFPEAKRVLLTAYADTEAAIASINQVGLDYYLMKPWHPPQERLYPILDELLEDWKVHAHRPFDGIRVVGALWSPASHHAKEFLTRHQIPYRWLDIDRDAGAREMIQELGYAGGNIPVIYFADGTALAQPELKVLAEKVGLQTRAAMPFYDLVIIGSGPAGLAAAVYASSDGLRCLVIERAAPGGQAGSSPKIENFFGFPSGISGDDLTRRAVSQAKRFGAEILSAQEVKKVSVRDAYRIVELEDGTEISCHAVLIATGASFHTLNMPGADSLSGAGVYYGAAYTEAMNYRDKDVFVVGGANSAGQAAMYLSLFARKVWVLIRGPQPTASKYLVDALKGNEKIEILPDTDLVELHGEGGLNEVVVKNNVTGESRTLAGSALFVFIGVKPQSEMVAELVERDAKGNILTGSNLLQTGKRPKGWTLDRDPYLLETSVPGIFAAGDVRLGATPRVASAVGEGAIAMALIKEYLKTL
jgi:thioredoxin reductase (NADPH)